MDDKHIFIGKHASITAAPNKSLIGLSGVIVNETKNTFVFAYNGETKTVLKKGIKVTIANKEYTSKSKKIEDRIKSR